MGIAVQKRTVGDSEAAGEGSKSAFISFGWGDRKVSASHPGWSFSHQNAMSIEMHFETPAGMRYRFRAPAEPSPPPIKEPPNPPENPDDPVREPDPEEPGQI